MKQFFTPKVLKKNFIQTNSQNKRLSIETSKLNLLSYQNIPTSIYTYYTHKKLVAVYTNRIIHDFSVIR